MDWKEELNKKSEELQKEENNGQIIPHSSVSSRSNNRIDSNVRGLSLHTQKINKVERRESKVITYEAVESDLNDIINGKGKYANLKTDLEKQIAALKVVMKFISTMRSNQLLTEGDKVEIKKRKAERDAKEANKK
jgi:hypothetical protein